MKKWLVCIFMFVIFFSDLSLINYHHKWEVFMKADDGMIYQIVKPSNTSEFINMLIRKDVSLKLIGGSLKLNAIGLY